MATAIRPELIGSLQNKTASQADHAGQPPSSFLFLHQGRARPAQGAGRSIAFGQVLGL